MFYCKLFKGSDKTHFPQSSSYLQNKPPSPQSAGQLVKLLPICFQSTFNVLQVRFQYASNPIPAHFQSASSPLPISFQSASSPLIVHFQSASSPLSVRFQSASSQERLQKKNRTVMKTYDLTNLKRNAERSSSSLHFT